MENLVIDPALGENAFRIGVLDLAHLGHQVGRLHQQRMRVTSRADHMHALGARGERSQRLFSGSNI